MADPSVIAEWAQTLGMTGGLIAILYGGKKRWWVWGWQYDAIVADRDKWQALALKSTDINEQAVVMK